MQSGTGLSKFAAEFKSRFFDVGIAEEHAVTMASGMSKQGMLPVCAIYSTFLQRAYDQIIHDTAIQKLKVVFAVDRAGIVGDDGETHNGLFDVPFLSTVPGMTILAPSNYNELRSMLKAALYRIKGPVAIRYPRGRQGSFTEDTFGLPVKTIKDGGDITIAVYGDLINEAIKAWEC
jgi:1-deoxy-D-xylulose-5-phosphate synthase